MTPSGVRIVMLVTYIVPRDFGLGFIEDMLRDTKTMRHVSCFRESTQQYNRGDMTLLVSGEHVARILGVRDCFVAEQTLPMSIQLELSTTSFNPSWKVCAFYESGNCTLHASALCEMLLPSRKGRCN